MGRPSHYRHWTEAEDAAIQRRAVVGWPTLRDLAARYDRTYDAIRLRASRLGAIRRERLDPAERGPTEIPCRYCASPFLMRGGARYCGGACAALARSQCPGCGRALKALRCSHCAVVGKRSDWPERAVGPVETD